MAAEQLQQKSGPLAICGDCWDREEILGYGGIAGTNELLESGVLEDRVRSLKIAKSWGHILEVGGKCGDV